jgi:hypothetical protein
MATWSNAAGRMKRMPLPKPPDQRAATVIQAIYQLLVARQKWPRFAELDRYLYTRHEEPCCDEILFGLPEHLVYGIGSGSGHIGDDHELSLSLCGLKSCEGASEDVDLFLRLVAHAVELEAQQEPDQPVRMSRADVERTVRLPAAGRADLLARAGEILRAERWGWTTAGAGPDWSFVIDRRVRAFKGVVSVDDYWARAHPAFITPKSDSSHTPFTGSFGTMGTERKGDSHPPAPASMHAWVAEVAESLWADGHYRQAVCDAARAIEVKLRSKLCVQGKTAAKMVTEAFGARPPQPGSPRLRFMGFEPGSDDWVNAHEGALFFGRGCMMRIRNLWTHGYEPGIDEAADALAALSLLARWIDDAQVLNAAEDHP